MNTKKIAKKRNPSMFGMKAPPEVTRDRREITLSITVGRFSVDMLSVVSLSGTELDIKIAFRNCLAEPLLSVFVRHRIERIP